MCDTIIPVFFLDPYQIDKAEHNKHYFSNNAVQFMCESLKDLDDQLRAHGSSLQLYYGDPKTSLKAVLKKYKPTHVAWNADYSAYAIARDAAMEAACAAADVTPLVCHTDFTMRPMEDNLSGAGGGFKQFGAFYKRASRQKPTTPEPFKAPSSTAFLQTAKSPFAVKSLKRFYTPNPQLAQHGGRAIALEKLRHIGDFSEYTDKRNQLDYNTTNLSAALNFGCISIREAYYGISAAIKPASASEALLRQLYWRDFYLQVVRYIPYATDYRRLMDERYEKIPWRKGREAEAEWERLMTSKTGFLLIDAAMQEMQQTGFMHNRARMLVVIFWTKYLLIHILHPEYGSQVNYSRFLVDAVGPSQNKMNHHWAVDMDFPGKKFSAPGAPLSGRPMDVSNKMIKKWDPEGTYVKRWLPHLKDVPVNELVKWNGSPDDLHPAPMFDPKQRYQEWIAACKV
jgi:deoxyribodipyrimidine photo-lyase